MEARVEIEPGQIREAVSAAILKQLDDETRNTLIEQAIAHLLTPKETYRGSGVEKSPVENAFNEAATKVMREIVEQRLSEKESELRKKVEEALTKGISKFVDEDCKNLSEKVAESLKSFLTSRY